MAFCMLQGGETARSEVHCWGQYIFGPLHIILCNEEAYLYSAYYKLLICNHSGVACVNEEWHSFTCHPHVCPQVEWTIPAFNLQPQSIATLWLVLISHPTEGRRLSWPGLLGEILRWFDRPKTVTRPSTCCGEWNPRSLSCEFSTWVPSHLEVSRCCMSTSWSGWGDGKCNWWVAEWCVCLAQIYY